MFLWSCGRWQGCALKHARALSRSVFSRNNSAFREFQQGEEVQEVVTSYRAGGVDSVLQLKAAEPSQVLTWNKSGGPGPDGAGRAGSGTSALWSRSKWNQMVAACRN